MTVVPVNNSVLKSVAVTQVSSSRTFKSDCGLIFIGVGLEGG